MLKALEKFPSAAPPPILSSACELFPLVLMKERIRPNGALSVSRERRTASHTQSVELWDKKGSHSPWWLGRRWAPSRNSAATMCVLAARSAPAGRGRRAGRPCLRRPCIGSRTCAAPSSSRRVVSSWPPLRGRPSWPLAGPAPAPPGRPSHHLRTQKRERKFRFVFTDIRPYWKVGEIATFYL